MGTCTSSSDIQVMPTINKKPDIDMIIIALTQILNTNHSTNKHLSLLLDNKLVTLGLSDPYSNKHIPDKIVKFAKQKYDRIKNQKAGEINYNTDLIIASFINYFKCLYSEHMVDIINTRNHNPIKDLRDFTASEYLYYAKYLLSIFNAIEGLDNIIYIGSKCRSINYINTLFVCSIIITTNKIIKTKLQDTYDSFRIVLNKLVEEYSDIGYDNLVNFVKNIKIIEQLKDKLIFSNKCEAEPFIKIEDTDYVKTKFINNLYDEYLQDIFRLIIIEDDESYKVSLEYKIYDNLLI